VDVHRRLAVLAVVKTCDFLVGMVVFAFDKRRHDAAERFQAERERRDVEKDDVAYFAGENAGFESRRRWPRLRPD